LTTREISFSFIEKTEEGLIRYRTSSGATYESIAQFIAQRLGGKNLGFWWGERKGTAYVLEDSRKLYEITQDEDIVTATPLGPERRRYSRMLFDPRG